MPKLLSDGEPEPQPVVEPVEKSRALKLIRWTATALAIGVLLAPLAIAVSALSGFGHRWPDILAQFTAPALVITAAYAAVLGLLRLKTAFGLAVVVVLALAIAVWPQWGADRGKPQAGAPVLTLYSANLYYLNNDTARIRASIVDARPDIVVLVEASHDVVAQLDIVLAEYPYRRVTPNRLREGMDGTVIASRYPLQARPAGIRSRNYAIAVVDTPAGRINVVGAHLTRPWPYQVQWEQIRRADALSALMSDLHGSAIVAGDFNSVSSARIGRQIQRQTGLKPNPGWPGTWPAQLPALLGFTIDQVYRTPDLAVISRRVGLPTGSDHRPVVTQLTRAEPRPAP